MRRLLGIAIGALGAALFVCATGCGHKRKPPGEEEAPVVVVRRGRPAPPTAAPAAATPTAPPTFTPADRERFERFVADLALDLENFRDRVVWDGRALTRADAARERLILLGEPAGAVLERLAREAPQPATRRAVLQQLETRLALRGHREDGACCAPFWTAAADPAPDVRTRALNVLRRGAAAHPARRDELLALFAEALAAPSEAVRDAGAKGLIALGEFFKVPVALRVKFSHALMWGESEEYLRTLPAAFTLVWPDERIPTEKH